MRGTESEIARSAAYIMDLWDGYTGSHARRTGEVVRILAGEIMKDSRIPQDREFFQCIVCAAPLHDLGKIEIDSSIFLKPGKLTEEEFLRVKKHPIYSVKQIERIMSDYPDEQFLEVALNMAKYHHEKVDGSGYPEGLIGDQIPLEARIMAIADVYDALVSKRPYKEAMSFKDAYLLIEDGMGRHFDERLNRYFLSGLAKIEAYYKSTS